MNSPQYPVVCTFESRRAEEMQTLIERFGGLAVTAPSMKEVPLEENSEALHAIREVVDARVDAMILLTGVGTDAMFALAESTGLRDRLLGTLSKLPLLVRGPKPAAVLKRVGLSWAVKAPEPNTWQELLSAIDDSDVVVDGRRIAVQEYGIPNPELYAALRERGAEVLPVPVYRWTLPDDIGPLKEAVQRTVARQTDVLLFTSAQQVRHVLQIAEQEGCREAWMTAVRDTLLASIGPTCSDAIRQEGLDVDFEASPPKMGPLVRGAIELWRESSGLPLSSDG